MPLWVVAKFGSFFSAVQATVAALMFCCSTDTMLETQAPNDVYACAKAVAPIFAFSAAHDALAAFVASLPAAEADAARAARATTRIATRIDRFTGPSLLLSEG